MRVSSEDYYKQNVQQIAASETVEEEREKCGRDSCESLTTWLNTNLPEDCLNLIFQGLGNSIDRDSFGLTCRQWLRIQNNPRASLLFHSRLSSTTLLDIGGPERFSILLCDFAGTIPIPQISVCPELTDLVTSQSQYFGSHIQVLYLSECSKVLNFCSVLSWFPRLTTISLKYTRVTDKGLEILTESCSSLQDVNLTGCKLISYLGVRFISQNCRELRSLCISHCRYITGTGLHGCSQTLTHLEAEYCFLKSEGIAPIVSGRGLEHLNLSDSRPFGEERKGFDLCKIGEGFAANLRVLNLERCSSVENNRTVTVISKGWPLLQEWSLGASSEVDLEGWQAIGLNCHNLETLDLIACFGLNNQGLQALCDGCSKLSKLYTSSMNKISFSGIEMFNSKRPNVICYSRVHA